MSHRSCEQFGKLAKYHAPSTGRRLDRRLWAGLQVLQWYFFALLCNFRRCFGLKVILSEQANVHTNAYVLVAFTIHFLRPRVEMLHVMQTDDEVANDAKGDRLII